MAIPNDDGLEKKLSIPDDVAAAELPDEVPLEAEEVVADDLLTRFKNMLGLVMAVSPAARANMSTMLTKALGEMALKNQLATRRPPKVIAALDSKRQYFYVIPVAGEHDGGIDVTYDRSRASLSLYKTFAAVDRLVPDGMRDFYPLKPTPGIVTVGSVKGYGLYCRLSDVNSAPMGTLSEETKAKREATRRKNQEKKKTGESA